LFVPFGYAAIDFLLSLRFSSGVNLLGRIKILFAPFDYADDFSSFKFLSGVNLLSQIKGLVYTFGYAYGSSFHIIINIQAGILQFLLSTNPKGYKNIYIFVYSPI
jgi:hypothetical protein